MCINGMAALLPLAAAKQVSCAQRFWTLDSGLLITANTVREKPHGSSVAVQFAHHIPLLPPQFESRLTPLHEGQLLPIQFRQQVAVALVQLQHRVLDLRMQRLDLRHARIGRLQGSSGSELM
jgi:hypothetical protein